MLQSFTNLRILEVAEGVPGPVAGLLLADLGADVIKVETPDGDRAREWGLPVEDDGDAAIFHHLNRGKRSIVLDIASDSEFNRLLESSDAVLVHQDPGAPTIVDWRAIASEHPHLIVCEINDLGSEGPLAGSAGSELTLQAMSGFTRYIGDRDGRPCRVGYEIAGQATGMHAFQSIVAALLERTRSGRGQYLAISGLGSLLSMKTILLAAQSGDTDDWTGFHLNGPRWPADTGWDTADGQVTFDFRHGQRDGWAAFCHEIGLGHLVVDPDYTDWRSTIYLGDRRFTHGTPYREKFATMSSAEVSALINKHGGISVKFQDYAEVLGHEQVRLLEPTISLEDGPEPVREQVGMPFRFGGEERRSDFRRAPRLDEHRAEILGAFEESRAEAASGTR